MEPALPAQQLQQPQWQPEAGIPSAGIPSAGNPSNPAFPQWQGNRSRADTWGWLSWARFCDGGCSSPASFDELNVLPPSMGGVSWLGRNILLMWKKWTNTDTQSRITDLLRPTWLQPSPWLCLERVGCGAHSPSGSSAARLYPWCDASRELWALSPVLSKKIIKAGLMGDSNVALTCRVFVPPSSPGSQGSLTEQSCGNLMGSWEDLQLYWLYKQLVEKG